MKYAFPVLYLVLFAAAIPWYWPDDYTGTFLGFPTWVVVSLSISLVISIVAAWQFLWFWPGFEEDSK